MKRLPRWTRLLGLAVSAGCASAPPTPEQCPADPFPLLCAIKHDNGPLIGQILDQGTPVNQMQAGISPLAFAAGNAKPETVQLLLDRGAAVNAVGEAGGTALDMAAGTGKADNVKLLLSAGANVRHKAEFDITALHRAAGRGSAPAVKVLIDAGALVNAKQTGGETALMFAASRGSIRTVQALLEAGADPRIKDSEGKTAYDHAKQLRFAKVAELLKPD